MDHTKLAKTLVAGLVATMACCIAYGSHAQLHQSDSLIPVLASLCHWTPFYWEQDRFGMLSAFLAMPIRDPWLNLQFQNWLSIASGASLLFLLPRYFARDDSWVPSGLLALVMLLLTGDDFRFWTLSTCQPYGISFSLLLMGAILWPAPGTTARRWRLGASQALLLLGAWVNVAGPLLVLLLWAGRIVASSAGRQSWRKTIVGIELQIGSGLVVAFLLGYGAARLTTAPFIGTRTHFGSLPVGDWLHGVIALSANVWSALQLPQAAILATVPLIALVAIWRRGGRAAAVMATVATVYLGMVGSTKWLRSNSYAFRYAIPSVLLFVVAIATLLLAPWWHGATNRVKTAVTIVLTATVIGLTFATYGVPSTSRAQSLFAESNGRLTADVIAAECTHLIGDYWSVWPAVFDSARHNYERGNEQRVWGITVRATPTEPQWRSLPISQWRLCSPRGDTERAKYWSAYHLPPAKSVSTLGDLEVFGF